MQQLKCNQHKQPFTLYCNICEEPICEKCCIIGPHHTQTHSLCQLSEAYDRRVNETQSRLQELQLIRDPLLQAISRADHWTEQAKEKERMVARQNQLEEQRIKTGVKKSWEKYAHEVQVQQSQLLHHYNSINDICYEFEAMEDIECVLSYGKMFQQLKEVMDRCDILLDEAPHHAQLPKQMTLMRDQLEQIKSFEYLYHSKMEIIKQIIKQLQQEKDKIKGPDIDYASLLEKLEQQMQQYEEGWVCHFCGEVLDDSSINDSCLKNQAPSHVTIADLQFEGFCQQPPDSSKFGTHRHYFAPSANPLSYYRQAYQTQKENSYLHYLSALFLKLKTQTKIRNKRIGDIFRKSDPHKTGICEGIVIDFALMEECAMTIEQVAIFKAMCETDQNSYEYILILKQLQRIDI